MRDLLRRCAAAERQAASKLSDTVIESLDRTGGLSEVDLLVLEISYRLDQLAGLTERIAGPDHSVLT